MSVKVSTEEGIIQADRWNKAYSKWLLFQSLLSSNIHHFLKENERKKTKIIKEEKVSFFFVSLYPSWGETLLRPKSHLKKKESNLSGQEGGVSFLLGHLFKSLVWIGFCMISNRFNKDHWNGELLVIL